MKVSTIVCFVLSKYRIMEMKGKSVEVEKEQACAIPMGMRINGLVDQYEDSINLEGILWTMNRRGGNLSGIGYLR